MKQRPSRIKHCVEVIPPPCRRSGTYLECERPRDFPQGSSDIWVLVTVGWGMVKGDSSPKAPGMQGLWPLPAGGFFFPSACTWPTEAPAFAGAREGVGVRWGLLSGAGGVAPPPLRGPPSPLGAVLRLHQRLRRWSSLRVGGGFAPPSALRAATSPFVLSAKMGRAWRQRLRSGLR